MKVFKNPAELYADIAHSSIGQKRKYTNYPYIEHPRHVAYLVDMVGGSYEMICAAYLHDVIEDVSPKSGIFTPEDILKKFGQEIYDLCIWLTDVSKPEDGVRWQRKQIDREHIAKAPSEAKTIKLADLIDNSLSITQYDPGFAETYLAEKRLLLNVLQNGNQHLWQIANDILIRNGH